VKGIKRCFIGSIDKTRMLSSYEKSAEILDCDLSCFNCAQITYLMSVQLFLEHAERPETCFRFLKV
jgi:hypothetical protein